MLVEYALQYFFACGSTTWIEDNTISKAMNCRLDGPGFILGNRDFYLCHHIQNGPVTHQSTYITHIPLCATVPFLSTINCMSILENEMRREKCTQYMNKHGRHCSLHI
jgi:hypothetical protein